MTIFFHEMKRGIKSLFIWAVSVGALILFCMALYPQLREQAQSVSVMFDQMGSFSAAFGMDVLDFATAMGFYGVECGACLALGGGLYAAFIGSGLISKEETGHTAEFLYTHPVSRPHILCSKFAAMAGQLFIFNVICVLFALAGFAIAKEAPDFEAFLLYHLAQFVMQCQLAAYCFLLSAFAKRSSLGGGLGIMAALYFAALMGNISDKISWVKYLTPFWYADSARIISESAIDLPLLFLGIGCGAAAFAAAIYSYRKKDICA